MHPTLVKSSFFENTMGNPFLSVGHDQNMDIIISNLHLESIFDFGKWSSGKFTNAHICVFNRPGVAGAVL